MNCQRLWNVLLSATIVLSLCLPTGAWAEEPPTLSAVDIREFWVNPQQDATLRFTSKAKPGTVMRYTICDFAGKEIHAGEQATEKDGGVQIPLKLPQGYYDLTLENGQSFGVIALPPFQGETDSFFSIDAAISEVGRHNRNLDGREKIIENLVRSGIGMARERINWGSMEKEQGLWNWECGSEDGKQVYWFESTREIYAKHKIPVLDFFQNVPGWMKIEDRHVTDQYPYDLSGFSESLETIIERWKPYLGALEIWNEPDISLGGELPATHYVPLVKAVAYTFSHATIRIPVYGGVFSEFNPKFMQSCSDNGMLDLIDGVSFHTYDPAITMEPKIRTYRNWLQEGGYGSLPLWITECGHPWKRGTDNASLTQDIASALDIIMKGVESRACGIDRYFPFIYVFYEEKDKNFGMMRRNDTPMRPMAAYAFLISALSGYEYVGDLPYSEPLQRVRVFRSGDNALVVYYSADATAPCSVPTDIPFTKLAGLDGRPLAADKAGTVLVADGLTYAWCSWDAVKAKVNADTEAMKLLQASREPLPEKAAPCGVILQPLSRPSTPGLVVEKSGYFCAPKTGSPVRFEIRVHNLTEQAQTVTLDTTAAPKSVRFAQSRQAVKIPPQSHIDTVWLLEAAEIGLQDTGGISVPVRATLTDGTTASPLTLHLYIEGELEDYVKTAGTSIKVPFGSASDWSNNIVDGATMKVDVSPEGVWRLSAEFPEECAPWAYPKYNLPADIRLTANDVILIRARCEEEAAFRLMLDEEDGSSYYTPSTIVPSDGEWHCRTLRREDFVLLGGSTVDENGTLDMGQIRSIQIGINNKSKSHKNTVEVSDLILLRK